MAYFFIRNANYYSKNIYKYYLLNTFQHSSDLCLVPQVYNAKRFGVEMSDFPRISEVAARLEALEEFKAAHPSVQPDAVN